MRVLLLASALLLLPAAAAQLPHPHPNLVHHPLTIESELRAMEAVNPEFAALDSFGESSLGWPLWFMDVHAPDADVSALPVYYLDANHHGNEQLGMESTMIFLEELVQWSTTEEGAARLADVRVIVAPAINPDGTGTDRRVNNNGVDLNRNYDYNWGLYGTSDMMNPVTGNYRGPSPASEPETMANADFMRALRPDVYLSMHTGSHDLVLPWRQSDDADGPMPDWPLFERWLAEAEAVSGLPYRDPSGAGESISYAYGALGAFAIVVEVDTLQFQPLVTDDLREILREEVDLFWYSLHNLERMGGHLVLDITARAVVNAGWSPAVNIVFRDPAGAVVGTADALEPTTSLVVPEHAMTVEYDRRIQGDEARPTWRLDLAPLAAEVGDAAVPIPAGLALVVLIVAAAMRRTTR